MSALLLGDTAPDFTAFSQHGKFNFHEWLGDSWGILLAHPQEFTPVCSTEIAELARLAPEFDGRGVRVATLSTGSVDGHIQWAKELAAAFEVEIDFPLIAEDADLSIAHLYGMVHPKASDTTTIRSVYVIDPAKTIRLTLSYPHTTGRNFGEVLRVIDSLQLADRHNIVTPVNWTPGHNVLVPFDVSDDDASRKLGPITPVLPYLRQVSDPETQR